MPSMDSATMSSESYGDGETIALEVIARGTATRPFAGREVGEPLDAHEVYIYTFRDGKIADVRAY